MGVNKKLYEEIWEKAVKHKIVLPEIPKHIIENLKYPFFEWQKNAFENLLTFEEIKERLNPRDPTHLMFNMATGTGKTLLMASCILHYYNKGYRKFIFFVNQKNIIYKTENNFINKIHNKYLFKDKIVIDDKTVNIEKVETFTKNDERIEIKLTTIQQLYNDIHIQKENQVILDDLIKEDIVMLADEAHHLNADTKKYQEKIKGINVELNDKTSVAEIEKEGWEHTVIELLLNKNGKNDENRNVLLEFTATIPEIESVKNKYASKTIFEYGLKDFLVAGYTKEINLLSSTLEKRERILQALLFNWYRHEIALKNNLANWKPVILFRSKTIDDSKSDYEDFLKLIKNLNANDFKFINNIKDKFTQGKYSYEQGKSRVLDLINYIESNKINIENIIEFIKYNFSERNCIITNSKTNKAKTIENIDENIDKLLNNLEDKDNHIRAIFTVNRLTEGWDVLNLFDIVRLYSGRDEGKDSKGNRKAGSTTISEVQLIGRGVRYYPFSYKDEIKNKRKFDKNLGDEMRVLEELYYHSDSDHRYIDELKRELKNKGLINDERIEKTFKLKDNFKESNFYKNVKVIGNERKVIEDSKKKKLDHINKLNLEFNLQNLEIKEEEIDLNLEANDIEKLNYNIVNKKTIEIKIKDFEKHIFEKAINIKCKKQNSIFRFEILKQEFEIDSLEDFRTKIIGDIVINIVTVKSKFDDITNKEKLSILLYALDKIAIECSQFVISYKGTDFTKHYNFKDLFGIEVKKMIKKDYESNDLEDKLKNEDWYVLNQFYGTSEEKELINFVITNINNLKEKYGNDNVYLLRNEEQYKIFDFDTGQGFQPDFLLFLNDKNKNIIYQVFIEPKGDVLLKKDDWKNIFLLKITEKYSNDILEIFGAKYKLIGLPLFNYNTQKNFKEEYNKLLNIETN